jgi:rod shape-determining protein MreC
MAQARYKRTGWKTPIELRAHRTGLVGFGLLAALILAVGRAEIPLVDRVRMEAADLASGVLQAGSAVTAWVSQGIDAATGVVAVYGENERLRQENEALIAWRTKALDLERRIMAFESVLDIAYTPVDDVTAASVIADTAGPFSRAIIVNAGESKGVIVGDAALDRFGLVGRVIDVGRSSSRVLLLTDSSSHVPVVIEPGGVRAILSGDSEGKPKLEFIPAGATLADGSAIVTSGDGGVLPPGLPVGVVRLRQGDAPAASLYADIARVEVVALKRYHFIDDVDVPVLPVPEVQDPATQDEPAIASNPVSAAQ